LYLWLAFPDSNLALETGYRDRLFPSVSVPNAAITASCHILSYSFFTQISHHSTLCGLTEIIETIIKATKNKAYYLLVTLHYLYYHSSAVFVTPCCIVLQHESAARHGAQSPHRPSATVIKAHDGLKTTVFWDIAPCSLVEVDGRSNRTDVGGSTQPSKRRFASTRLHGVIYQRAIMFILTAVRT
jgi:hypothetical protein